MAGAGVEINLPPVNYDEDVVFSVDFGADFLTDYLATPTDLLVDYAVATLSGANLLTLTLHNGLELDPDTGAVTFRIARRTLRPGHFSHLCRLTRVSSDETRALFGGHLTIAEGAF